MDQTPNKEFGHTIFASDLPHIGGSPLWRKAIQRNAPVYPSNLPETSFEAARGNFLTSHPNTVS